MASFNKSIIMGNICKDVETKTIPSGLTIAEFSVAVNERVKKGDNYEDQVSYFDATAFGKTGENIAKYFSKGSPILLECKLRQERWQDKTTGAGRSKVKLIVDNFSFCESKGGGDNQQSNARPQQQRQAPKPEAAAVINDEDIPF